jgi:hypothetical protein
MYSALFVMAFAGLVILSASYKPQPVKPDNCSDSVLTLLKIIDSLGRVNDSLQTVIDEGTGLGNCLGKDGGLLGEVYYIGNDIFMVNILSSYHVKLNSGRNLEPGDSYDFSEDNFFEFAEELREHGLNYKPRCRFVLRFRYTPTLLIESFLWYNKRFRQYFISVPEYSVE